MLRPSLSDVGQPCLNLSHLLERLTICALAETSNLWRPSLATGLIVGAGHEGPAPNHLEPRHEPILCGPWEIRVVKNAKEPNARALFSLA